MDSGLVLARTEPIYSVDVVEKAAKKLGDDAPRGLPRLYQRMVEAGGDRFVVKPSKVPDYHAMKADLPNFGDVLDKIFKQINLCVTTSDALEIMPILLLGDPGIGKTRFGKRLSKILNTGFEYIPMQTQSAGWILSGSASTWGGARTGKVFDTLVNGQFANPVILVDEIDKASKAAQYDPIAPFYTFLEKETARNFVDEFAEVPIDAGRVIWIATANDLEVIPDPIQQRFQIFHVPTPTEEETRVIMTSIYREEVDGHEWGRRYPHSPSDDVLDRLTKIPPREIVQVLRNAFGNACAAGRHELMADDIEVKSGTKRSIGF